VLRGRDLEQRERKLLEAQRELLNDRATLEKTNESAHSVNEKTVSYLSEQLADSMGQTVICQSRIDTLHMQMEELRTNSRTESNIEVAQMKKKLLHAKNVSTQKDEEHKNLYTKLKSDLDVYKTDMQSQLKEVNSKLHGSVSLVSELTSRLEGSEANVRLLHAKDTSVSKIEAEHNTLYMELQDDVDKYRANMQMQLQEVNSKLQRSVTLTSELTSKLEGSETKVGDLMGKLSDKHTQIVALSEKLVASGSGYQKHIQEGSIHTAKFIDDQQKISSEHHLKMSEMCKQLETSKNEMEIHRKTMQSDKKRTQSLIVANRLELETARSESNRLASIVDHYQTNCNVATGTDDSSESLRIMIRQSLPDDLHPESYDELVNKVMATMSAHE
jgi:hypothetical protein